MFRRLILGLVVLAGLALVGASASTAEARGCYRGGYGGGGYHHYPSYRTTRYYGGHHHHGFYGPTVYRSSYYGGYPVYRGGYRSGVSLSFGF